jgi:hypothetical protein
VSVLSQQWAAGWVNCGLATAGVNVPELERLSGINRVTIYNIIEQEAKNGCRVDVLHLLVRCCGLQLPDPPK